MRRDCTVRQAFKSLDFNSAVDKTSPWLIKHRVYMDADSEDSPINKMKLSFEDAEQDQLKRRVRELEEQLEKVKSKLYWVKIARVDEERHSAALKEELARAEEKVHGLKRISAKQHQDLQHSGYTVEKLELRVLALEDGLLEKTTKQAELMKAQLVLSGLVKAQEAALREGERRREADTLHIQETGHKLRALEQENSSLRATLEELTAVLGKFEAEHQAYVRETSQRGQEEAAETKAFIEKLELEKRGLEKKVKEATRCMSSQATSELSLSEELAEIIKEQKGGFIDDSDVKQPTWFLLQEDCRKSSLGDVLADRVKVTELEDELKMSGQLFEQVREYVADLVTLLARF
jgi:chromosome segregation ATPase